ncbi:hypothetical protein HDU92_006165, partial [Lobulomyces angularis]
MNEFHFEPQVDLFADHDNKKVFHYYSKKISSQCSERNGFLGENAFDHSWKKFRKVYAYPVFRDIRKLLYKLRQDRVRECVVIFPLLSIQNAVRRKLEMLSVSKPLLLPHSPSLWSPKTPNKHHSSPA